MVLQALDEDNNGQSHAVCRHIQLLRHTIRHNYTAHNALNVDSGTSKCYY